MKANINDNILLDFGNKIKQFRKDNGLTQSDLLDKVYEYSDDESSIDERTLRNIENGKQIASLKTLRKIMICFQKIDNNITLSWLLGVN